MANAYLRLREALNAGELMAPTMEDAMRDFAAYGMAVVRVDYASIKRDFDIIATDYSGRRYVVGADSNEWVVKPANRCDCPGCVPRRSRFDYRCRCGARIAYSGTPIDQKCAKCGGRNVISVSADAPSGIAHALRFAGLNAPNRKQYGVAQYRAQ